MIVKCFSRIVFRGGIRGMGSSSLGQEARWSTIVDFALLPVCLSCLCFLRTHRSCKNVCYFIFTCLCACCRRPPASIPYSPRGFGRASRRSTGQHCSKPEISPLLRGLQSSPQAAGGLCHPHPMPLFRPVYASASTPLWLSAESGARQGGWIHA